MQITIREIFDLGLWERFCKETGMNEWAVAEGLLSMDEKVEWILKSKEEGK